MGEYPLPTYVIVKTKYDNQHSALDKVNSPSKENPGAMMIVTVNKDYTITVREYQIYDWPSVAFSNTDGSPYSRTGNHNWSTKGDEVVITDPEETKDFMCTLIDGNLAKAKEERKISFNKFK